MPQGHEASRRPAPRQRVGHLLPGWPFARPLSAARRPQGQSALATRHGPQRRGQGQRRLRARATAVADHSPLRAPAVDGFDHLQGYRVAWPLDQRLQRGVVRISPLGTNTVAPHRCVTTKRRFVSCMGTRRVRTRAVGCARSAQSSAPFARPVYHQNARGYSTYSTADRMRDAFCARCF